MNLRWQYLGSTSIHVIYARLVCKISKGCFTSSLKSLVCICLLYPSRRYPPNCLPSQTYFFCVLKATSVSLLSQNVQSSMLENCGHPLELEFMFTQQFEESVYCAVAMPNSPCSQILFHHFLYFLELEKGKRRFSGFSRICRLLLHFRSNNALLGNLF
jgi:hypothetical protein